MNKIKKDCDRSPALGLGGFLIAFGILMGAVILDVFNLGAPGEYVKWQILLLFIGTASLFSGKIGSAFILFAVGTYFLLPELDLFVPEFVDKFYWPAAIILVGLAFIIAGIFRKARTDYQTN